MKMKEEEEIPLVLSACHTVTLNLKARSVLLLMFTFIMVYLVGAGQ